MLTLHYCCIIQLCDITETETYRIALLEGTPHIPVHIIDTYMAVIK